MSIVIFIPNKARQAFYKSDHFSFQYYEEFVIVTKLLHIQD